MVSAQDVSVAAGELGAGLDVSLSNTGPSPVDIGGFTFELTVGDTAITFTNITTSTTTAPYIFDGLGLFGPNIGLAVNDQDWMASDIFSVIGSGTTLASNDTVGLGAFGVRRVELSHRHLRCAARPRPSHHSVRF